MARELLAGKIQENSVIEVDYDKEAGGVVVRSAQPVSGKREPQDKPQMILGGFGGNR